MAIWTAIFAVFGIAYLVSVWLNRYQTRNLIWPNTVTYYGMKDKVRDYLAWRGWKVRPLESTNYDFIVSNNSKEFALRCYPSNQSIVHSTAVDFAEQRKYSTALALLIVAADEISRSVITDAVERQVYIFHYKSLPILTSLDPASVDAVRNACLQIALSMADSAAGPRTSLFDA